MTTEQLINQALADLDCPAQPEAGFAGRLRGEMLGATGAADASGAGAARGVPTGWQVIRQQEKVLTRRKLLDLAAVAALLLAMIGGLASTTQRSSAPSTVSSVSAPEIFQPIVQNGGTAAQDNQFSGPVPISGTAEVSWTIPVDPSLMVDPGMIAGNTLFTRISMLDDTGQSILQAYDVSDRTLQWQALVMTAVPFAVSQDSVVVGVPLDPMGDVTNAVDPFSVAMLDRKDGRTIWKSSQSFHPRFSALPITLAVTDSMIYVSNGDGHLSALSLNDGSEVWSYDHDLEPSPQAVSANQTCIDNGNGDVKCHSNPDNYAMYVAAGSGTVYVSDALSLRMTALDATDGSIRWDIDLTASLPDVRSIAQIVAITDGVAVTWQSSTESGGDRINNLGMYGETKGSLVWLEADLAVPMIASDGEAVFATLLVRSETIVIAIDGATGTIFWHVTVPGWVAGYFEDEGEVLLWSGGPGSPISGMRASDGKIMWTLDLGGLNCSPVFPGSGDDQFLCPSYETSPDLIRIDSHKLPRTTPVGKP